VARTAFLAVALVALMGLAVPPAASGRLSVRVDEEGLAGEGFPGKALLIDGDTGDDTVRLVQEDRGVARRISVLGQGTVGNGCVQVISSPARIRCETDGIVQIIVLASPLDRFDPTAERNTADLSGVTQVAPDGAPLADLIGGGPGPDVIVAGAGRSLVGSFGGNDQVDGGAGDDEINEGSGNDIVLAGEGNDNFGGEPTDDSDIISGGPGRDSMAARGVVTLNDLLCNDGSSRDAPEPIDGNGRALDGPIGQGRSVRAPEGSLECSGTGADRDLFAGIEEVTQVFDDGAVDFTGSDADEAFQGHEGDDRFEGGGGRDSLVGLAGDDLLLGRDQGEDALLDCGEGGGDRAVVDAVDPVEPSCETIERGSAGVVGPVTGVGDVPSNGNEGNGPGGGDNGQTPPELEIPTPVAFVKNGRIQIRVRCVYRAQNCVGRLTLRAAQSRRAGRLRVRRGARLASGRVNVPWGTSRATTMRAPRRLVRLLRRLRGSRTLRVRATVVARDSAASPGAQSARRSRVVVLGLQR
jgi:Ca2+-binding RTX toxin-like protein